MGGLEAFLGVSIYCYLLATLIYGGWFVWRRRALWLAGGGLLTAGLVSQIIHIAAGGILAGRPPLANVFETLVLFSACTALGFLLAALRFGWKALAPPGALVSLLLSLLAQGLAPEQTEPLVPALRSSFLLTVHVAFCFVSYVSFLLAYFIALASLVRNERHRALATLVVAMTLSAAATGVVLGAFSNSPAWHHSRLAVLGIAAGSAFILGVILWPLLTWTGSKFGLKKRLPDRSRLEDALYQTIAFGFPFLSLGIALGSVWANQAWGRYWGWDPKEVAALITWLVYAIYLHMREDKVLRRGWPSWAAVIGFWCVLFTYFGVNYLLAGLHSHA